MEKKKRVFLFGAGAVLEWNAPKTWELTELILNSGFKACDEKTTITRYLYQKLLDQGYNEKELNFETIISIIEEFVVYYAEDDRNKVKSFQKCFFDDRFHADLLNFTIPGGRRHGYVLQIPKGIRYPFAKYALHGESPEQFFYEHLIGDLLNDICARIIEYSYYSKEHSAINLESESSRSFIEWMMLHQQQSPLRMYTLNYDKVFKVLLVQAGIDVFEGFNEEDLTNRYGIRPNVKRILEDFDSNIHYNLHGSINWDVKDLDPNQLPNPEIFYRPFPNLPGNNTPASVQVEKGKTLMVTNIITGYQKAQKSMISPFKQMQSAFDRDCSFANEVYIIGYSFGDEHINTSIRTAIRHNPELKIIVVDPYFMKNNLDLEVSLKLFSAAMQPFSPPQKIDNNVHLHQGSFVAYSMTFAEFRERQLSPSNRAAGGILSW